MPVSPSPSATSTKKGILLVPVVGIILFAFGILLGYGVGGKAQFQAGYDKGKGEGETTAVKKLEDAGVVPVGVLDQKPQPVMNITGTVVAVSGDSLDVEGTIRTGLLTAPVTKTWKIAVTDETAISRNEIASQEDQEKAQTAFERDLNAYNKKITELKEGEPPPMPPEPPQLMKSVPLKLDDLKEGMLVSVTTKEDLAASEAVTGMVIILIAESAAPMPTPGATAPDGAFVPPPPPPPPSAPPGGFEPAPPPPTP